MTKEQFAALGLTEEQAKKAAEASTEELKNRSLILVSEENKNLKTTVKENAAQLENLKKSAGDNEELKTQIATLQADNAIKEQEYQKQLKDLQLSNAIKTESTGSL